MRSSTLWLSLGASLFSIACRCSEFGRGSEGIDDGMVDLGQGVSMHLHCLGRGTPVVIFEHGKGEDGTAWGFVQPEVARATRACAYDRTGAGYSTRNPKPHTSREMVAELHRLLVSAK